MAVRTISTSIKLDGEQEFKKQMSSVNSELKTLKSEMALVTSEFKGQANSVDALTDKNRILRQQYAQQAEKVRALQQAVADSTEVNGEAARRTDELRRDYNYARIALSNLNEELRQNEKYLDEARSSADRAATSIDEYGREVKQAAQESGGVQLSSPFKGLDDAIGKLGSLKGALVGGAAVGAVVAGVQAVTDAITEVVDASEEYRKVMGTLEVSSQAAGYTTEQTAQTYERLYSVLGDNQTAATTTANLQAIGLSQEELMQITDASIGAWARYGDSIPIDGLAEAINETIQAGQVTGTFADVLNWAGTSEDAFNTQLQAANSSTERANLVLQELARQGLAEVGQAWRDTNADIVAANDSQRRFEAAQAELGESLSPLRDKLRDISASGMLFLSDFVDGASRAFDKLGEVTDQAAETIGTGLEKMLGIYGKVWDKEQMMWVDAPKAIQEKTAAIEENAEQTEGLLKNTADLQITTEDLTGAESLLNKALSEQTEQKTLSVDTTLALIDAGYTAAIVIDQETGAVTLNKEAYIAIAKAKIDDQIASLETQRTSVQNALAMKDEALMATELGKSYYSAAEARQALEGQKISYSAQIAALNQLKKSIGSYQAAALSAAKTSATASQTAKTQAEKDLETFRNLTSELDHLRAMDKISEQDYYDKLSEYRDRYLTEEANVEEYRKVTEQIYKYDKALSEKEAELWEDQTEALAEELQDRVDTILDQQKEMAETLADYGDLFKIEDDEMSLESLQEQIDAIGRYEDALSQLKERGVAAGLMDAVLGMDVDEATQYTEKLLSLTDEQFESYSSLWEEKQQRAKEVAEEFYADQLDALETEYNDKLGETLSELTGTAFQSGQNTAQGLIDGLASKEPALYQKAQEMMNQISGILNNAQSGTETDVDGSHAMGLSYVPWDGYIAQLHQGERVLTAQQARALDTISAGAIRQPSVVTAEDLRTTTASAINALGTLGASSGGRYVIELRMDVNGKEFYRETIEDFRTVNREKPEVLDD